MEHTRCACSCHRSTDPEKNDLVAKAPAAGCTCCCAERKPGPTMLVVHRESRNRVAVLTLFLLATLMFGMRTCGSMRRPAEESVVDDGIKWVGPCEGSKDHECATLLVPLNHLNKTDDRKIPLSLIRYKAQKSPRLGSILVNPGGPGGSGVDMARYGGESLSRLTGGQYDIVGFDPRGISRSKPVICFPNPAEHAAFERLVSNLDVPGAPGAKISLNEYAAYLNVFGRSCKKQSGEYVNYISTAFTARDMDLIREAVGDELINYWGFSYGTYLGMTYANMFPNKVGRYIIDGVTDPETFAGSYADWARGSVIHLDEVYEKFGSICESVGPVRCPLAALAQNATLRQKYHVDSTKKKRKGAGAVATLVSNFVLNLAEDPLPAPEAVIPGVLTYNSAQGVLFQLTYSPLSWGVVAKALADTIGSGRGEPLLNLVLTAGGRMDPQESFCPATDTSGSTGFPSVKCSDGEDESAVSLDAWGALAEEMQGISYISGRIWTSLGFPCKYWPSRPVERFAGPWKHKMKNKIFILANTLDPVTPLESAQKVFDILGTENSVLLIQDGLGHCSLSHPSLCTMLAIERLFTHGELPKEDVKKCTSDYVLFPPQSGDGLMAASEGLLAEERERIGSLSLADLARLEDARKIGEVVSKLAAVV
ncbi:hypothetical protein HDU96_002141 [Phlyctochytrium bullatum]|nr:hypothetical protein HDU96_002141 [Phlyctochytrium bullatum]